MIVLLLRRPRASDDENRAVENRAADPTFDGALAVPSRANRMTRPTPAFVETETWRLEPPPPIMRSAAILAADIRDQRRRRRLIGHEGRLATTVDLWAEQAEQIVREPIDPAIMAEAESWVDQQLASSAA